MSKTLKETQDYILELQKEYNISDKSTKELLENIEVDENGLVSDIEIIKISNTIRYLSECRENIINKLNSVKKMREKKESGN